MMADEQNTLQQAVIFALQDDASESSVAELVRLLDTAGAECVHTFIQNASCDVRSYIGKGKAEEIALFCKANGITLAVCNDELSPSQIKNLEDIMDGVEVIDRSMLILEIFQKHAQSSAGKLQVEIAQLRYTVPRLIGKGAQLSRQGGGGGGGGGARRGAGESKLETDKRHVQRRIEYLEAQFEEMERTRDLQRKARKKSNIPCVAVAGYTNAGKSTLLNYLTGAGILAEDKLFATLDTTTRKFTLPDGNDILLTDTVGFIQKLPHHLIKAFRSTLEEVAFADAILIVADMSDENCDMQIEVCEKLLAELGVGDKPTVYAFNKCDLCEALPEKPNAGKYSKGIKLSAKTGEGTELLCKALSDAIKQGKSKCVLQVPHRDGRILDRIYRDCGVISTDYGENGTSVVAMLSAEQRSIFAKYISEG